MLEYGDGVPQLMLDALWRRVWIVTYVRQAPHPTSTTTYTKPPHKSTEAFLSTQILKL